MIIFQVLSDETDYVGTMGGWASLDPLILSISEILNGFQELELSSEENVSLIKTKAEEVDQKLETLKELIQTQSDQANLEDYSWGYLNSVKVESDRIPFNEKDDIDTYF